MSIIPALAVVALLAFTASVLWVGRVLRHKIDWAQSVSHPDPTGVTPKALNDAMLEIYRHYDDELAALKIAVSEGIAGFQRHEKRVQKTVTSARRLLRDNGLEHAGLEAEAQELRDTDGEGSEPEPVQPVPETVEDDQLPSGIPGLTNADVEALKSIGAM